MVKDNFSDGSEHYALYRPQYPDAFYSYLFSLLPKKGRAWDAGTGNGQNAYRLAPEFREVYATDISTNQLKHAIQRDNIFYSQQASEYTDFPSGYFDLCMVAQAIHWFDFEKYYQEVRRVATPEGMICVLGYGTLNVEGKGNPVIQSFYERVVGPYWDKERRHIVTQYREIPFPFREIHVPNFTLEYYWDKERIVAYINTWSSVKHFIRANGYNPTVALKKELSEIMNDTESVRVFFPLLKRIGFVY